MWENIIKGSQYAVVYDEKTKVWRILDTLHPKFDASQFTADDEIKDDNPAVTIVPNTAFVAMVQKAMDNGMLQKLEDDKNSECKECSEYLIKYQNLMQRFEEQSKENSELKNSNNTLARELDRSESFQLKTKAMDSILKITGMHDMKDLGKE